MNRHGQIALKGFAMGMADLVPGVSGGTIAFIAGIYDPLLNSLSALSGEGLACVRRGEFNLAWKAINGPFLLALGVGILTAVVTLAAPLHWLLEHEPVMLRAFFTGLVAASVPLVGRHLSPWNAQAWVWAAVGCAVAGFVTSLPPLMQSTSLWLFMASGMIAICAMLLPGISGSFLLLILGAYAPVLSALKSIDVAKIAAFGGGAVIGLLAFSRGLKWLLANHRRPALATLTGFLVGSLQALWPWKENGRLLCTLSDGREKYLMVNVPPVTGDVWAAAAWMCLGATVVWGIHRWGEANKQAS